jgi:sodium-dependent dicarboxylate transporter 2/3/5
MIRDPNFTYRLPIDRIGLVLGPVVLLLWWLAVPSGLPPAAHMLMGILLLTILWWITEPIPIPATALLAIVLCVMLGAVPLDEKGNPQSTRKVLAPFADPSLFFMLGGLFLGRAMARHGLDRRIALAILCSRWASRSPAAVLLGVGLAVALVSMGISNTSATAMVYPVTMGIIAVLAAGQESAEVPPEVREQQKALFLRSPYPSVLLLMTAYASGVGGIATPIGSGTNVVARGILDQPAYLGRPLDFLRWALVGVPMMLLMLVCLFLWLRSRAPAAGLDLPALRGYLHNQRAALGPWRAGEVNTLAVFGLVVTLWILPGLLGLVGETDAQRAVQQRLPEDMVALLAPILLFLLPVDWQRRKFSLEVEDFMRVDWGTILLFGSGMTLGVLLVDTGLARAIGDTGFRLVGTRDLWLVTGLAIAAAIFLSEIMSNAAAVTALIPVVFGICNQAGVDPIPPLLGVTFAASFGNALPVSTPPNAIVYSSGLIPLRRMIGAGLGMDVLCGVVIWLVLRVAWALGWSPLL